MTRGFDQVSVPPDGTAITYEDGFTTPDAPIVPFSPGVAPEVVAAARQILDAAAERMGREIHWMRVYTGEAARDRYGNTLPAETLRAFRQFRLGICGPLADDRGESLALERELRRRLGVTTAATRCSNVTWHPPPGRGGNLDVTLFRDVSEDVAASLEFPPGTEDAGRLRDVLRRSRGGERVPDDPAGFSVSPISRRATEALVDAAVDYAFEHDRRTVTVAHQGDLRPATEGSFLDWAREYLAAEYGDGVVDEATFRAGSEEFPDDELVVFERRTDELCRELLVNPSEYDVVLAPALGGTYLSAVAGAATDQPAEPPELGLGDGQLLVTTRSSGRPRSTPSESNSVPLTLAGCLLFDYLGWADAASVVRAAVSRARTDGVLPGASAHRRTRGLSSQRRTRDESVDASEVAAAIVDRIETPRRDDGAGGVATTPAERAAIKSSIAALYNAVFADSLSPGEIELNQLLHEDEEADVYLPEVGLNFHYWRQWPVERRLEVLLHELGHVEEESDERDHGDEFYERFVELVTIAADWRTELEAAFGEPIDFDRVYRFIVESVHEETIEPDRETVDERKRWLREQFSLDDTDHY